MICMPIKPGKIVGDQQIRFFLFDKRSNELPQFLLFLVQCPIAKVFLHELRYPKDCCHCLGFSCANIFEAYIGCYIRRSSFSFGQKHQRHCTSFCREMMQCSSASDGFIICMRENNEHMVKLPGIP